MILCGFYFQSYGFVLLCSFTLNLKPYETM